MTEPTVLFLLGVTPRCGTNFLFDLLRRHPDIDTYLPIGEDYILQRIGPLAEFASSITGLWQDLWKIDENEVRRFVRLLGGAIESFLANGSSARYVLTKTPATANAQLARQIFPRSPVIFLVRDGRSVCESARLSFGTRIEEMTRRWADSGKLILDVMKSRRTDEVPYLLVRYEDLFTDNETQLRRLFEGLGLDADRYDFAGVSTLPVRGSSVLRGGAVNVHWRPVVKSPDFDPLSRHRSWDKASLDAFDAVAGDVLAAFGYSTQNLAPTAGLRDAR